ncbi:MAG TPA: carboxypeptidase-like regulatory domain-containing protein, partial [Bryobacteraceae bacterium]|nr:carboxypeptidase-like regulatory domain-containing protein [Bryobacteraceae bacterium]
MTSAARLTSGFLLFPLLLSAQFRAAIEGVVSDSSGGSVPAATVTLNNNETQRSQKVQTSSDGFYRFSGLPPGTYTLTAEKPGFRRQSMTSLRINAEEVQGQNLTLTPG